jgi:hypothetical protein
MFTSVQLLNNWHEHWPSNQGEFDFGVMMAVGTEYYTVVDQLISFLYHST